MPVLEEGIHYYINEHGLLVFTEKYHLDRGYCCRSGCKHCPYHFNRDEEKIPVKEKTNGKGKNAAK